MGNISLSRDGNLSLSGGKIIIVGTENRTVFNSCRFSLTFESGLNCLEKCILSIHKYDGATGLQMLCIVSDKNLVWQYQKKSVSLQKYSKEEYCTFPIVKHIYSK